MIMLKSINGWIAEVLVLSEYPLGTQHVQEIYHIIMLKPNQHISTNETNTTYAIET